MGRLLIEAQGEEKRAKYGDNLIKEYSIKLQKEVNRFYNVRTLRRMRQFYLVFKDLIRSPLATNLTWSHCQELLSLKSNGEIYYYIEETKKYNLSRNKLREKIKSKEYERLSDNTKLKLSNNTKLEVQDLIKNPIVIKNPLNKEVITEKVLKQLILEDIPSFLKEFGDGFSYVVIY